MKCYRKYQHGQSLVEVIVAIGAMSILLIALLSLVSLSLRNSRLARDRARGVALAQEGVELMRAFRDYSWSDLEDAADGGNYNLPVNWVVEDGLSLSCQQTQQISGIYYRCARLDTVASDTVEVEVEVGWLEGSQWFTTNQISQLTIWQR